MFVFWTCQVNCVINFCIWCKLGWATNGVTWFSMCHVTAQKAREDGKSNHHVRDVLPWNVVRGHNICWEKNYL